MNEFNEMFSAQVKGLPTMLVDLPSNLNVNRNMGVSSKNLDQQSKAKQIHKDLNKKALSNAKIKFLKKG